MILMICFFSCPVDSSIFPAFEPDGNALQSVYEAFRFTESYGVIFQCNVKYCLGPCEPVSAVSHDLSPGFQWTRLIKPFALLAGNLRRRSRILGQEEEAPRRQRDRGACHLWGRYVHQPGDSRPWLWWWEEQGLPAQSRWARKDALCWLWRWVFTKKLSLLKFNN